MKLSIVIPSYNYGQYIEKAIISVLSQDYPDKELFVIDGGSTDNTINVLKEYESKIKWVSEKDKGQFDAINKGLWMSSGDIFAYLNADDYYENNVFSDIVRVFKNEKSAALIYGNCRTISLDELNAVINIPQKKISRKDLLQGGNITYQPSTFFRASTLKKEGGVSNLRYMMEYDMNLKVLKHGGAHYIDKVLSNFLKHPGQKSDLKNERAMMWEIIKIRRKHGGSILSRLTLNYLKVALKSLT